MQRPAASRPSSYWRANFWAEAPCDLELRAHEARDGVGGLAELLLGLFAAVLRSGEDAVGHVVVQQPESDGLERLRHRRHLGEDVDAVLLLGDHALQATRLALDALEPTQVLVFVGDVAVMAGLGVAHGGPRSSWCSSGARVARVLPLGGIVAMYPIGVSLSPICQGGA